MALTMHSGASSLPGRGAPRARGWRSLLGLAALCVLAVGARAEVSKEFQIKAAFLYNFAKFVEWPASRFAHPGSPIVIGVLGKSPFGDELENIVHGRKVNGRDIVVVALSAEAQLRPVHVLFVPAGEEPRFDPRAAAGMLTVGDSERFAAQGGMITFVLEGDKVRFTINLETAERAGLKISAQLLKLASSVQRKSSH